MKEKMKAMILNLIKEKGSISFAEIENMFDDKDIEYNGDSVIGPSKYKMIHYWINMSDIFASSIIELREENKIEFNPCDIMFYFIDGKILKYPIVTKKYQYEEPHWLPIMINFSQEEKLKREGAKI